LENGKAVNFKSSTEVTLFLYTFVPLVSGLALRARLISILPLVFIAGPTDRKCTDIASNEGFPIKSFADIFTTYLADLAPQTFQGLSLGKSDKIHTNESIYFAATLLP